MGPHRGAGSCVWRFSGRGRWWVSKKTGPGAPESCSLDRNFRSAVRRDWERGYAQRDGYRNRCFLTGSSTFRRRSAFQGGKIEKIKKEKTKVPISSVGRPRRKPNAEPVVADRARLLTLVEFRREIRGDNSGPFPAIQPANSVIGEDQPGPLSIEKTRNGAQPGIGGKSMEPRCFEVAQIEKTRSMLPCLGGLLPFLLLSTVTLPFHLRALP